MLKTRQNNFWKCREGDVKTGRIMEWRIKNRIRAMLTSVMTPEHQQHRVEKIMKSIHERTYLESSLRTPSLQLLLLRGRILTGCSSGRSSGTTLGFSALRRHGELFG